jgi:hypothetical protein
LAYKHRDHLNLLLFAFGRYILAAIFRLTNTTGNSVNRVEEKMNLPEQLNIHLNKFRMRKVFYLFPFMRIPKLEYPQFVNDIIAITEKYHPESFYINGLFGKLKEVQPSLKNLEVVYKKEPNTAVLKELRFKRENLLIAILAQIKAVSKAGVPSMSEQLKLVLPFTEKYFGRIMSNNTKIRSERINQMFAALDADTLLQTAMNSVGLGVYLNELRPLQLSMENTQNERRAKKSARPKMKTKEVKEKVTTALTNFLRSIELSIIEHPEVDYMPLVNEINDLLLSTKTELKARETRNKTAADEAKAKGTDAA